jgi:hypothetical protein
MILVDFTHVGIASIFAFKSEVTEENDIASLTNVIRHALLSTLKSYKKKYGVEYGEMVLACDGSNCWRKSIFPYYKAKRRENREKSDINWQQVFSVFHTLRQEIAETFPYRVIHHDEVEADDIIAVLASNTANTNEKTLIISSDHDFKQLQKYKNVRQWSPLHAKFVECLNPQEYLLEHIARAGDDGIPNVLSNDDTFVIEGGRQSRMTKNRLDEFISKGRDACQNENELRNWDRNNILINFECIPDLIRESINRLYIDNKQTRDLDKIMNYLIQNRCSLLLNEIEDF